MKLEALPLQGIQANVAVLQALQTQIDTLEQVLADYWSKTSRASPVTGPRSKLSCMTRNTSTSFGSGVAVTNEPKTIVQIRGQTTDFGTPLPPAYCMGNRASIVLVAETLKTVVCPRFGRRFRPLE